MKVTFYLFVIALSIILLQNCANPKPPTGGEKDLQAPVLDTTFPSNYSLNVKGKRFTFIFNERIQLNSINKNLLITPFIDNDYKTTVKRNKLTILFENQFKPNTTYTFNFGPSIRDVTEKNSTKNLTYVFSTGDYLDSLQLSTTAYYPLSNKPCPECLVSIYNTQDTANILTSKPSYFTYTNKVGKARIENIKHNNYSIYVLDDKNKNFTYDKGESIAMHSDTINLTDNLTIDKLFMISSNVKKQKIKSQSTIDNNHRIKFKKGIKSMQLFDTNYTEINNIKYWFSDNYNINIIFNPQYNEPYNIVTIDSSNIQDTLPILFKEDTVNKFINVASETSLKENDKITFSCSNNVLKIDTNKFSISLDTIFEPLQNLTYDSIKKTIEVEIPTKYKEEKRIVVMIDSNAIQTKNLINNKLKFKYTITPLLELGTISGNINCEGNYSLELLDQKNNILIQIEKTKTFLFDRIKPGTYKLRIKMDSNNNGIWDKGSFENNELPEPIIFHNQEIKLRKNWEIKDINISCPSK